MKRKILSASAKVFLEKGYSGTSSKMVADLVGVSNGSPFFHYGNKEGVLLELVKWMFSGQFRTAESLLGDVTDPLMLYGLELMPAVASSHTNQFSLSAPGRNSPKMTASFSTISSLM